MDRRNLLRALCLAPLVPVAAKLAVLEGPPKFVATATNFGALTQAQIKVWSRDLFREVQRSSDFTVKAVERGFIDLV